MSVKVLDENNFEEEVLKSNEVVLVDFYADWCGPCKAMSPIIDEIAEEINEVKVGKVNVDNNEKLSSKFDIVSIPTLLIFKDGTLTNKYVGLTEKETIINELKK